MVINKAAAEGSAALIELTIADLKAIEAAASEIEVIGVRCPEYLEKTTGL